ncbi:Uncharacterized [Syntrophomonas zehnderi OL-4]|uniref:Uncharacterized n=1 Tax=Syntrophomonas zehnderi OL-4 TaxID=690567 RepID=A0A0E4GCC5_9FIRM|nr:DUF5693 family protein [Syntrophomonas zehnderi]CFX11479.1 Uncharacterized [Syntrophomonas zehnderi OL-4]
MKNRLRVVLWITLLVALLLSMQGFILRTANEAQNKTLITAAEYQLFEKNAEISNMPINEVLKRLEDQGVNAIAVKETSLRDLAARGSVYISSLADFTAFSKAYRPDVWGAADRAIGQRYISPANLVVVSADEATTRFLQERLENRFTPQELVTFAAGGQHYFIVNAELPQLDKSKNAIKERDTLLGFEENILDSLKEQGFSIILRPGNTTGSNTAYLQEYERLIDRYDVKTLIFGYNSVTGYPDHLDVMEKLVDKYDLTIGVAETSQQLGYIPQEGLDKLIKKTNYPINRVYSTSHDDFVKTVDERYYRWVRGVIDRGIRIVYLVPFKDDKKDISQNLNDTIDTVGRFHETITAKGFVFSQPAVLEHLDSSIPGAVHRLLVSISLLLATLLYLEYLLRPQRKWILGLGGIGLVACVAINLLWGADFSKVYALAAAILYPTFSSLLLLLYLKRNSSRSWLSQLLGSLAILLAVNALGMYTIVTTLADIRYIMNIGYFSGVKVAFLVPLLLFPLNYLSATVERKDWLDFVRGFLRKSPSYLVLGLSLVALVALYVYIGRSGNESGIEVSSLEIRLREILEMVFLARPRFKEFIIGYPALMAMVYLYRKYKQDLLLLVLGFGVLIGSISMVNSFCHVFTAVTISVNRTLAGLLTGLIVGSALLLVIWITDSD